MIGPLLFIVMMGDINKEVKHSNDTRISTIIHSTQDTENLQQDLQAVYKWTYKNNMTFNSEKFEVIWYGQNKNLQEVAYTLGDNILVEKSSLKDLGVWLNRDCSFREHVTKSAKNGRQMMGWILQTFIIRNP